MPRSAILPPLLLSVGLIGLVALGGCNRSSSDATQSRAVAGRTLQTLPPALPDALAEWPADFGAAIAKAEQERDWTRLAKLYHANGFLQRAETCYLGARNEDKRSHAFQRQVADLARQRGEFDAERAALEAALRVKPTAIATRLALADSFERAGKYGDARKHYEIVLEQDPVNGRAVLGVARDEVRRGEHDQAHDRLRNFVAEHEGWPSAYVILAELEPADSAAAIAWHEKAWGRQDPPEDDRALSALLPLCFNFEILSRQFQAHAQSNDAEGAARIFKRMVAVDENSWQVLRYRAFVLIRQYKPAEAAAFYERALAAGAPPAEVYPEWVDAWRRAKQPAKALEVVQAGLRQLPRHPRLLEEHARLLLEAGRPAEARVSLDILLEVSAHEAAALLLHGDVMERLGNAAEARKAWQDARAALEPTGDPAVRAALAQRLSD